MAVPNRTEVLDDLYTTTWNNRKKEVTDQIFTATPLTNELFKRGGIKLNGTGGRFLEIPLAYAKNETVTSLGRGDTVSLSETKFLTVAQFNWKYIAGTVIRYFVDDTQNKSVSQHINWANAKIDNLRDSMTDNIEGQLFGDGTGNSSKDLNGLANLIDATPTVARTVGNIAQTTYTWWQNQQKTSTGAASVYLLSDMRNLANTCSEGKTRMLPNILITTQVVAELFDDEVLEQRMIINTKEGADPESMSTAWKGIPLQWSNQCPSGRMYFISSKYLGVNIDSDVNFEMTEWKTIPNQVNDRVAQIVVKLEAITNRRRALGVLTAIA